MPTRRRFLASGLAASLGIAGWSQGSAAGTPTARGTPETPTPTETGTNLTPGLTTEDEGLPVQIEEVTLRPTNAVAMEEAPDGRRYVTDLPGIIHLIDDSSGTTALDIEDKVETGDEMGLLGLALHPDFESNGRLYVRYSSERRPGTPDDYNHTFVLAEFRAQEDGTLDRDSERTVLEIPEPLGNHNSGRIAFGPDEYLYVGVGDGGGGNDDAMGHVEDWYDANPGGNGQDVTENLLGSILRIDVDSRSGEKAYGIPDDNPLVGEEGLDEHYAWGFRNPWGISFDGEDLYVADVGQNTYEEVNLVVKGGNYGWNVKEGTECFQTESCPSETPDGNPLRDPIIQYPHEDAEISGDAVIGGHVYRGNDIPALRGRYIFGDLHPSGQLFVATPIEEGLWPTELLPITESTRENIDSLLGMARDRAGELYALTRRGVYRLNPSS